MSDIFHERDMSPLRDTRDIDEPGVSKKSLKQLLFDDDKEETDSKRFRANTPTNLQVVPDGIEVKDAAQVKLESTNAESAVEIDLDQENEKEPSPYLDPFQCEPDNNMTKPKIESHDVSVDNEAASCALTPNLDPNLIYCSNSAPRSASPSDSDFFTAGSTENVNLSQPNSPTGDSTDTAPISVSSDSNPRSVGSTDGTPLSDPNPLPNASADTAHRSDYNTHSTEFTDAAPHFVSSFDLNTYSISSTDTALHSVSSSIANPPSADSPDTAPLSVSLYDNNTRSADFTDTALLSASPSEPNPFSSGSTDTASLSNNPSDFAFFFNSLPETVPNYTHSPYPNHFSADSSDRYNSPTDIYTRFADSPDPTAISASPPDLVHCCGSHSDDGGFSVSPVFSLCSPSPPDSDPSTTSSFPPHPDLNSSSAPLWIPENEPPLVQSSNVPYSITVASTENLMVDQHQREPNQPIGTRPEDCIQPSIQTENNSGNHPYPGPNSSQGLENAENVTYASGLCASEHHQSPIVQIIRYANSNSRRIQASPYHLRVPEPDNWQTQRFVLGLLQAQRRFNRARLRRMQHQQMQYNGRGQQPQQFRARRIPGQQFRGQQFQPQQFQPQQFQPQQFQAPQFQFYEFQVPLFQPQQLYAQQFQDQQQHAQQQHAQQQHAQQQRAQQQYAQQQYVFQQQVQNATRSPLQTYPYYAQQWRGQQRQPPPYHAQQYSAEQSQAPLYYAQEYSAGQNQASPYHAQQHSAGQVEAQQHQGSQPQRFFRSQRPVNNKHSHRILLPGVIQLPVRPANQIGIRFQRRGTNFRDEPAPASFEQSIPVTANYPSNQQGDDIAEIEIVCPNENHGLPLLEDEQYDDYPDNCPGENVEGSY